jgi:hypothetical protein
MPEPQSLGTSEVSKRRIYLSQRRRGRREKDPLKFKTKTICFLPSLRLCGLEEHCV